MPQLNSSSVAVGAPASDAVTFSGLSANAGGTVTYNFYAGSDCMGSPLFSDSEAVNNGVVQPSRSYTNGTVGTYSWQAIYSGDANNRTLSSTCQPQFFTANQPVITPVGSVAGASTATGLPRTGMPGEEVLGLMLSGLVGAYSVLRRR